MYVSQDASDVLSSNNSDGVPDEDPLAISHIATHTNTNINTFKAKHSTDIISATRQIDLTIDNTVLNVATKIANKKELASKIYALHHSIKLVQDENTQANNKNAKLVEKLKELKLQKQNIIRASNEIRETINMQRDFANDKVNEITAQSQIDNTQLSKLTQSIGISHQIISSNKICFDNLIEKLKSEYINLMNRYTENTNIAKEKEKLLRTYNKVERNRSKSINTKSKLIIQLIHQEQINNLNHQISQSANKIIKSPQRISTQKYIMVSSTPSSNKKLIW